MKAQKLFTPLTLLFFVLIILLSFSQLKSPNPLGLEAAQDVFSAERAMAHIQAMSVVPHPSGSTAQSEVADYLVTTLQSYGYDPIIQESTGSWNLYGAMGHVQNVIVRVPGSDSQGAILLMAHADSVPVSPGAGDDLSAVAVMMETLNNLRSHSEFKQDLIFLFTDNEENGALGSFAFFENHPWAAEVKLVINLEACMQGPVMLVETNQENGKIIQAFSQETPHPLGSSWLAELFNILPYNSDYVPYKTAGIPGYNIMSINATPRYHTPTDSISYLNSADVQHHGNQTAALVNYWADADLTDLSVPNRTFFTLFKSVQINYPSSWAFPITLITLIVLLRLTFQNVRKYDVKVKNILIGFVLSLAAFFAFIGLTYGLWFLICKIYPHYQVSSVSRHIFNEMPYFWAFGLLAVAAVFTLLIWLQKKAAFTAWQFGMRYLWVLFAALTAIWMPGFSYLFSLPLLFSLIPLFWTAGEQIKPIQWVIQLLSYGLCLLIFVPFIYMLALGIGVMAINLLPAFIFLLMMLMSPILSSFEPGDLKIFSLVLVVGALLCLVWGSINAKPTAQYPYGNQVQYLYNMEQDRAYWVVNPGYIDPWLAQFVDGETVKSINEALPISTRSVHLLETPVLDIKKPEYSVEMKQLNANLVHNLVHINADPTSHQILFYLSPGAEVRSLLVDGYPIDLEAHYQHAAEDTWQQIGFAAPQNGYLDIEIISNANKPLSLWVVSHQPGLPGQAWESLEKRPENLMNIGDLTSAAFYIDILP